MQCVFPAARAELLQFDALRVIAPVFLSRVIPLAAFAARQVNYRSDIFLFASHSFSQPR
jgi:hypothetical protein